MEVQIDRGVPKAAAAVTKQLAEALDDTESRSQRILSVERDEAGRIIWYLRSQQGEKIGSYMSRREVPEDEFGQMRTLGELGAYFKARLEAHQFVA